MNRQRGFTLFELLFVIFSTAALAMGITLLYWIVIALMKFVGS